MPICIEQLDFGTILDFRDFPQKRFGTMFWNKRLQKTLGVSHRTAPCRDPVFPKTKVITVPFGPNGFLKVIFRWRLAYLRFLSVFVCAFVYITFLSFFIIPQ